MTINVFSLKDYSAKRALELAGGTNKGTYILVQITSFGHKVYAGWSDKNVFSRVKSSAASLFKKKQFVPDFAIVYNMGRTFGNNVVDVTALVEKHLISMLTTAENNHLHVLNTNQRISCNVGHLDDTTLYCENNRARDLASNMINLIKNHDDEIVSAAKPAKPVTEANVRTALQINSAKTTKALIAERIKSLITNSARNPVALTASFAMKTIEAEFGELGITVGAFKVRMDKIRNKILENNPNIVLNLAKPGRQPGAVLQAKSTKTETVTVKRESKHKAVIEALEVLILKTQSSSVPVLQKEIFEQLKAQGLGTDLSIYNFRQIFITARKNVYAKNPDVELNLVKRGKYWEYRKAIEKSNEIKSDTSAQDKSEPVVPLATTAPNYRPRFNFDYNIAPIGNEYFVTFMPVVKKQSI